LLHRLLNPPLALFFSATYPLLVLGTATWHPLRSGHLAASLSNTTRCNLILRRVTSGSSAPWQEVNFPCFWVAIGKHPTVCEILIHLFWYPWETNILIGTQLWPNSLDSPRLVSIFSTGALVEQPRVHSSRIYSSSSDPSQANGSNPAACSWLNDASNWTVVIERVENLRDYGGS